MDFILPGQLLGQGLPLSKDNYYPGRWILDLKDTVPGLKQDQELLLRLFFQLGDPTDKHHYSVPEE